MKRSDDRILTTHTGSLPRPAGVPLPGTAAATGGTQASEEEIRQVVADTVRQQAEAGVDVVNDGEVSKPSYATYVVDRLTGFDAQATQTVMLEEAAEFPEYFARLAESMAGSDCGFATFAQVLPVDPRITWAKLAAMAEGARLARARLW